MKLNLLILSALLIGCAEYRTPSQAPVYTDRISQLETKLDRLIEHSRVADQDREEILKYNQCAQSCSSIRLEQPVGITKSDREKWWDRPDVIDANLRANECYKSCDKIKPKSQPDWSC